MKIRRITIRIIAILPKIHSVESPFLPKIHSIESLFLPKIHSVELPIRQINLTKPILTLRGLPNWDKGRLKFGKNGDSTSRKFNES